MNPAQARGCPGTEAPFCWQSKHALQRIREGCEDVGTAIGVYVALTVLASDAGSEEFTATHEWLSALCGLSRSTVIRRIKDLERLGLLKVDTPPMKAPCRYRLLRCVTMTQRCVTEVASPWHTYKEQKEDVCVEAATSLPRDSKPEFPVEPAPSFPKDLKAAVEACAAAGVPPDFVQLCFLDASSRGGRDIGGQLIRSWPAHVSARYRREQSRQAERRQSRNSQPPARSRRTIDHTKGF